MFKVRHIITGQVFIADTLKEISNMTGEAPLTIRKAVYGNFITTTGYQATHEKLNFKPVVITAAMMMRCGGVKAHNARLKVTYEADSTSEMVDIIKRRHPLHQIHRTAIQQYIYRNQNMTTNGWSFEYCWGRYRLRNQRFKDIVINDTVDPYIVTDKERNLAILKKYLIS